MTELEAPSRPLEGGRTWRWLPPGEIDFDADPEQRTSWFRIYHHDGYTPTPIARRSWGPLNRFDHHLGDNGAAWFDPSRSVTYLARDYATAVHEIWQDTSLDDAYICPRYYVALLRPVDAVTTQDLTGEGCIQIRAIPDLASGSCPRPLSQEWARAIYEDRPADNDVAGVRYLASHDYGQCLAVWDTAPGIELDVGPSMPDPYGRQLVDDFIFAKTYEILGKRRKRAVIVGEANCPVCRAGP